MTAKDLWQQYQYYVRDLTAHGRTIGLSGAAICWLFKDDQFKFPGLIYFALLSFVAFFISDIFQGLAGALMVRFFTESQEARMWKQNKSIEGEIHKPRWVDYPAFGLFLLKCVFLITGFVFIGSELIVRLLS